MSFLNFDLSFLFSETSIAILFLIILSFLLYYKRDKLKLQKILFIKLKNFFGKKNFELPFVYMILYKAKWGIKSMDKIAKKHPKIIGFLATSGIYVGFLGMILIFYFLAQTLFKMFISPTTTSGVAIAQPFYKTQIGSPFFYIPFSYFIIAIFIIATIHEFSHGVVARLYNVKIKSSGFAFFSLLLPIIPAAFVEPDNNQVKKIKIKQQMAIFAAGPLSNILLAVIVFLLMFGINTSLADVTDSSVMTVNYTKYMGNDSIGVYPAEQVGVKLQDKLIMLDDTEINNIDDFVTFMDNTSSGQEIVLKTNSSSYNITLAASPQNSEKGYLGLSAVDVNEYTEEFKESYSSWIPAMEWFFGLLIILFMFNLGVGLMNLAPLGGLDGGQMVLALLKTKYKEKEALNIWGKISLITLILLLANIFVPMIMGFFM